MQFPTKTHRYPLLVLILAFLAVLIVVAMLHKKPATDIEGCNAVKYPKVCAVSYHKCNMIGLDAACLAVAQLDGQLGYDSVSGRQIPTSQNTITGDKPVESVHK